MCASAYIFLKSMIPEVWVTLLLLNRLMKRSWSCIRLAYVVKTEKHFAMPASDYKVNLYYDVWNGALALLSR